MLADKLGEWLGEWLWSKFPTLAIVLFFIGVGVYLLWLWRNKIRPRPKSIISPYPSLTIQNGGELMFFKSYKIKRAGSTPVKKYRLNFANSGAIIIPAGRQTIIFDYDGKVDWDGEAYAKDLSAQGVIESGKKYVLKSVWNSENRTILSSIVPVDNNKELKEYLRGYNYSSIEALKRKGESALSMLSQSKYDEAIAEFTEALKIFSNDDYLYNCKAHAYMHKGDYRNAIKDYSMAIMIKPNDAIYIIIEDLLEQRCVMKIMLVLILTRQFN